MMNNNNNYSFQNDNQSQMNNLKNSFNSQPLQRTPLQPKSLNRGNMQSNNKFNDSFAKVTPIKIVDFQNISQVRKIDEKNEEDSLCDLNNNYINYEDSFNYNKDKNMEAYNQRGENEMTLVEETFCSTDEKSMVKDNLCDDPMDRMVVKAMDFFENENFLYITPTDLRIRERVNDYINEDLCFYYPEEGQGREFDS